MLGRTDRRLRLVGLLVGFSLLGVLLGARLAYWQVVRASDLREQALAQLERVEHRPSERGRILDSSGTVVLAATGYRDLLAAHPDRLPEAMLDPLANRLARILELDRTQRARLRTALAARTPYLVVARELTQAQSRLVRRGLDNGTLVELVLEPRAVRDHPSAGGAPASTLASQLLGFVNAEGVGQYGLEQRYEDLLAGSPEVLASYRDASGRVIGDSTRILEAGRPGTDIRLTIDASLQLQVEKELHAAWVTDGAMSVSAVVLDPDDGSVLAWGTAPGYDANAYRRVAADGADVFVDPVLSAIYEPGSVLKMMVAAAGYSNGTLRPGTKLNDTGSMEFGKDRIDDSDKRAMGWMTFEDVIAYSRNVGAARAALLLGPDVRTASAALYQTWSRLGIGQRTGVDVAGEVAGIAVDPHLDPWPPIDLANRSFGQGVAVTPLQLATSFTAMVNGGLRIQPHVVAAVGS
jgi:cell division protein FtsI/penicillin-binding protein 2